MPVANVRQLPPRMSAAEFRTLALGRRAQPKRDEMKLLRRYVAPEVGGVESPLPLTISLPFLPPSVNKLFATIFDDKTGVTRRVLTSQARRIRRLIFTLVRGKLRRDRLYELQVEVFLRAYTKSGSVRQVDLTNRIKFLEDCVCAALGIDDRQIFRVILNKTHATSEQTRVVIDHYRAANDADAA
ncbi:MAG: RusA family crossover junction endodeoxyribonuclease [Planctomycetes bacterium]|nr:RusA family crossover junction endodeoxyribonuclease [Planctomycetota bacterium]